MPESKRSRRAQALAVAAIVAALVVMAVVLFVGQDGGDQGGAGIPEASKADAIDPTEAGTDTIPRGNCAGLDGLGLDDGEATRVLTSLGQKLGNDAHVAFSGVVTKTAGSKVVYAHEDADATWYATQVDDYRADTWRLTDHVEGVNDAQFQVSPTTADTTSPATKGKVDRPDTSDDVPLADVDGLAGLEIPTRCRATLAADFDAWAKRALLPLESGNAGVWPKDVSVSAKGCSFEIDAFDDSGNLYVVKCEHVGKKGKTTFERT